MFHRVSCYLNLFTILTLLIAVLGLDRQELLRYLKYQQDTRSTFDSRIDQSARPIGYVDEKPIWPRILEKVPKYQIFYDENNAGVPVNNIGPANVIYQMDREENYKRTIDFLSRLTE
uniref:Peptidase_M14 domain-containing protein n=1 Tax=Syphacia muris TaxID=451379 RepID=A0A0N5AUZ9_9BILA